MSHDTENFGPLRRLLALKRHEQPPPGYFNDFSQQVIIRIKAGESGEAGAMIERLLWEAPWLKRIWAALEAKPILVGVCGVAMCGLLIAGVIYSDRAEVTPLALVPMPESDSAALVQPTIAAADHPLLAKPATLVETSSTSPVASMPTEGPLLGDITRLRAQPASLSFPGAN